MTKTLEAVYENGLLRPLEPLPLEEHQRVTVTIADATPAPVERWLDREYLEEVQRRRSGKGPKPTLEQVRRALSAIPGNLSDDIRAEREDR